MSPSAETVKKVDQRQLKFPFFIQYNLLISLNNTCKINLTMFSIFILPEDRAMLESNPSTEKVTKV